MGRESMYILADGREVPVTAVAALEDLEKRWPGSTLAQARPAIVAAVLKSVGWVA